MIRRLIATATGIVGAILTVAGGIGQPIAPWAGILMGVVLIVGLVVPQVPADLTRRRETTASRGNDNDVKLTNFKTNVDSLSIGDRNKIRGRDVTQLTGYRPWWW